MDIRSPLNQCIALSLAGILFLNPIVATAAGLALDKAAGGNTGLGQAGNGVPIVNIATPNGAGLSNNHFRDYNVGANGLILNNATGKTQGTQLGGIILGNPNLKGQAAQVILNQVTGGNRSTLAGYTEVAGQSARVIVANPHGITCQGCGFINTPRATLTTGKPIMDGQRLERFQVDGGDIVVEGAELNVGNLEQFDLITRSAKLNAKLYAKNLNIVTGRNDVQAECRWCCRKSKCSCQNSNSTSGECRSARMPAPVLPFTGQNGGQNWYSRVPCRVRPRPRVKASTSPSGTR